MSENKNLRSNFERLLLPPSFDDATYEEHETEAYGGEDASPTGDARQGETLYTDREDPSPTEEPAFPVVTGYRILRKLGQGGMGSVYLAVDEKLDRQVAIKIVTQHVSSSPRLVDRFVSEVKSVAGLNHPNIAQLYEADMLADSPYFIMEYVDGPTLEEFLQNRALSPLATAQLIQSVANAIEYCHQKNIIHRDLKPSNILLDSNHNPKVADFGLAKSLQSDSDSTKTGEIGGT